MQILVTSPRADSLIILEKKQGFTLLELLVVLFLLSLLTGLTLPYLAKVYDSVQFAYEREEVLMQLSRLSYLAFREHRDFKLVNYPPQSKDDNPPSLEWPKGWQITSEAPIDFFANGVCQGGIVQIQYQEKTFKAQLIAPFCQAKWL